MAKDKIYKIGIDARMYRRGTGGIGTYTHALLQNLAKLDRKNKYYVFLTNDDLKEFDLKAKNFYPICAPYPHYSISEQLGFWRLLNKFKLDLIHFTNTNFPILYSGKFVITIHDITMILHPAFGRQSSFIAKNAFRLVLKKALKKSKIILTDSQNTKKDLIRIMKAEENKIKVVYLGVDNNYHQETAKKNPAEQDLASPDQEKLRRKYGIAPPYLLFVSQWRPHKGIINLVKSFEILNKRFKMDNHKLVITGKPNPQFPEIEKNIKQSPLRNRIITPGFVDEKDMAPLYSSASAFIFPSIYEGFGLNPLEAMACGIPVATSNISCIPEVCHDAALYFDPRDPEDIALKTHTLLTNEKLRQNLINKGFENLKRFSWQKMTKETLEIYQKVLHD